MSSPQLCELLHGDRPSSRILSRIAAVKTASSTAAFWAAPRTITSSGNICTDNAEDGLNIPGSHAACPNRSNFSKVSSEDDVEYHFNNKEEYDAASQLMSTTQRVCNGFLGPMSSNDTDTESIEQDKAWSRACSKLAPGQYTYTDIKHQGDNIMESRTLPCVDHTLKQGIFSDEFASVDSPDHGGSDWTSRASTPSPSSTTGDESTSVSSRLESSKVSSLSCSDSASSECSGVYSWDDCERDLEQAKDSLARLLSDMGILHVEYPIGSPPTVQDTKLHSELLSKYMDKNGSFDFFVGAALVDLPMPSEFVGRCNPAMDARGHHPLTSTHDSVVSSIASSNASASFAYTPKSTIGSLGSSAPTTPSYPKVRGKRLRRDGHSVALTSGRSASDSQLIFTPVPPPASRHDTFEDNVAQEVAWRQQAEQCFPARTGLRPAGHTLAHGPVSTWQITSISERSGETRSKPASRSQHTKPRHDPTAVYQTHRKSLQDNPNDRILQHQTPEMARSLSKIWNTMCLELKRQAEFGPGCGCSIYGTDEVGKQKQVWKRIKALANKRDEAIMERMREEKCGKVTAKRGEKGRMVERVKGLLMVFKRMGKDDNDIKRRS